MSTSKNPPGRPTLDRADRSVSTHVMVPGKLYDAIFALASRERINVAEAIRRAVRSRDGRRSGVSRKFHFGPADQTPFTPIPAPHGQISSSHVLPAPDPGRLRPFRRRNRLERVVPAAFS